jgi:DNA invertase Pin-like site-specific DNA recombinase
MPITAYSYCRVSSNEQRKKGLGLTIQKSNTLAYCLKHNFKLNSNYDEVKAYSAFSGANVTDGNLGRFLTDARAGKIKGVLITHSVDRLARTSPLDATQQMNEILSYGIDIHIISTGRIYSGKLESLPDVLDAILVSATAFEESKKKSNRSLDNWQALRNTASPENPMSKSCRAWLELDKKTGKFIEKKAMADIVRQIYQWSIDGFGVLAIVKKLNEEPLKYPPVNKKTGWQNNYVQKILSSEAVMGNFQPHQLINKKRVPIGDVIKGYYPEVVDEKIFQLARLRAAERKVKGSGRKGIHGVTNLFMGLIKCGSCGVTVVSVKNAATKIRKEQHYLICNSVKTHTGCKIGRSWDYLLFENEFFQFVKELDWNSIFESNEITSTKNILINQIAIAEKENVDLTKQFEKLKLDLENIPDDLKTDFFDNVRVKKQQISENESTLKNLKNELITHSIKNDKGLTEKIISYEIDGVSDEKRIMLAELIRNNIKEIKFYNDGFSWNAGDDLSILDNNLLEICYNRGYKKTEQIEHYMMTEAGARLLDQFTRRAIIIFTNDVKRTIFGGGYSMKSEVKMRLGNK